MEAVQQQIVEAKKNERANALKEVKHLLKEFGFTAEMLNDTLAEGRKRDELQITYGNRGAYSEANIIDLVGKKYRIKITAIEVAYDLQAGSYLKDFCANVEKKAYTNEGETYCSAT